MDFNPRVRTKPGRLRPALVLQSNLVNEAGDPSTIVIPTTSRLVEEAGILRFRLREGDGALDRDSDLLLGQLTAVANESFRKEIGNRLFLPCVCVPGMPGTKPTYTFVFWSHSK